MIGSDIEECKKICERVLNEKVWNRIVTIEECLFGVVNPSENGNFRMEAVIGEIIVKKFAESICSVDELLGLKIRLEELEEKQKKFQTTEENLKDTEEKLKRTQEKLDQTIEELHKIKNENENLQQKNEQLNIDLTKEKEKVGEVLEQGRKEKEEKDKEILIKQQLIEKMAKEYTDNMEKAVKSFEDERGKKEGKWMQKEAEWNKEEEGWKKKESEWEADNMRKKDYIRKLEGKVEELKERKDNLKSTVKNLEDEREDLKSKLEKSVSDFKAKQMQYEESVQENHKILQEKEKLVLDLENLRQNLEGEQKKVTEYHNKFGIWDEDTKEYQSLLDAMFRCDSLSDMLQWYEIKKENGVEDVSNILKFVGMFCGAEPTAFLKNLYNFLEDDREENKKYLSPEEIHLFDCLNQYYRQQEKLEIEYDLIRYPEAGDKFDKNMMTDMEYRTKIYRTIEGVYVPTIMRDERNPLLRALIKGV